MSPEFSERLTAACCPQSTRVAVGAQRPQSAFGLGLGLRLVLSTTLDLYAGCHRPGNEKF